MFDVVKFLLRFSYYYSRLIGVVNFEFDTETGRATISRKATIYAAVVNTLTFSLVPLLIYSRVWQVFWVNANSLHQYIFLAGLCLRIICVFVSILSRWSQRRRIVQLMSSYRRLVQQQPQVMRLWRRGVISKAIAGTLTECIHVILALHKLSSSLTPLMGLTMFLTYILIGLLNVILSQFYFSMLTIHGHYVLFNHELRSIVAETRLLERDPRQDMRILKSGLLANRLNNLARLEAELQKLLLSMQQIFGLQTLCMCLIFNISVISGVYYAFSAFKYMHVEMWSWHNFLLYFGIICYVTDTHITYSISYYMHDLQKDMIVLLAEYPTFSPGLGERLEFALENFQFQFIRNPPQLTVMGLFNLDRKNIISMASALISYSIILIQHDIKNYRAA